MSGMLVSRIPRDWHHLADSSRRADPPRRTEAYMGGPFDYVPLDVYRRGVSNPLGQLRRLHTVSSAPPLRGL